MVTTSVCYGIAGGIWLVIAIIIGLIEYTVLAFGITSPIPASHFLVGYVIYRRRFRLLGGTRYAKHSSLLGKLSLALSMLILALAMAVMA